MISLISSFGIVNAVTPDSNIFLWIPAFVAAATVVNYSSIKVLLANGLSTSPIKSNPVFSSGSYSKSAWKSSWLPYFTQLSFANFILAEELFAKAIRNLCIS